MDELFKRGFDARLADGPPRNINFLLDVQLPLKVVCESRACGPMVYPFPFTGAVADEVTVYVLFGLENNPNCAGFLVTRNSEYGDKVPSANGLE